MQFRTIRTVGVINQLMSIDAKRTRPVRSLVQFDQHITPYREQRRSGTSVKTEVDIVLPLDLIANVIGRQGISEWNVADFFIEVRATRIAAVLMPKSTAARCILRWVPCRVHEAIGPDHRIAVVYLSRATIV